MPDAPSPTDFAAWMAAETAAYSAIHELHQRTQGGRLGIPDPRIEQIARLRKEADVRFASLWGTLGAALQASAAAPTPTPAQPVREPRPAFERRRRASAEPAENRSSLA